MNQSKCRSHFVISIFLCFILPCLAGCKKKDMSLKLNEPRNIKGVVSYKRSFGDLNDVQLKAAHAWGIAPLASREEAEEMDGKLVHIVDNDFYVVDSLTHSIPYLVPRASALLDTIGANFLDSLTAKGLNPNKIIVTSVLRTENDVKRLRRRNGNASKNSCHFYGTTFDVSWKRFKKVEDEDGRPLQDVSADTFFHDRGRNNILYLLRDYNRFPEILSDCFVEVADIGRHVRRCNRFPRFFN